MRTRASSRGVFAGLLLLVVTAHAQARQHLLPPSRADRATLSKKIDPALLPEGASHLNVDPKQVFNLVGPSGTVLSVAAVNFDLPNPPAGTLIHSCGMYVVPAHEAAYFLDGTPDEGLPIQCLKVVSVRLKRKGTEPPDIIFVGADSLTSHSWLQEFVLTRRENGKYELTANYNDIP